MWRLMMTNAAKEWIEAGGFETLTAAARRSASSKSIR